MVLTFIMYAHYIIVYMYQHASQTDGREVTYLGGVMPMQLSDSPRLQSHINTG